VLTLWHLPRFAYLREKCCFLLFCQGSRFARLTVFPINVFRKAGNLIPLYAVGHNYIRRKRRINLSLSLSSTAFVVALLALVPALCRHGLIIPLRVVFSVASSHRLPHGAHLAVRSAMQRDGVPTVTGNRFHARVLSLSHESQHVLFAFAFLSALLFYVRWHSITSLLALFTPALLEEQVGEFGVSFVLSVLAPFDFSGLSDVVSTGHVISLQVPAALDSPSVPLPRPPSMPLPRSAVPTYSNPSFHLLETRRMNAPRQRFLLVRKRRSN